MAGAIELVGYERKAREAVMGLWGNRERTWRKQIEAETADPGKRGGASAGPNMDGFIALVIDMVRTNGLAHATIHRRRALLTSPKWNRPARLWDLLVLNEGRLVAAIKLKSQVGPSPGSGFQRRTDEARGTAHDVWTAYREGAFGEHPRPFVAWMMLVEDAPRSQSAVRDRSPHFPVFPEFQGASYLQRYDVLCQRLVQEQLYTTAAVIASPRTAVTTGEYIELSEMTSLKTFVTSFAGHAAAEAARG